jgi:hypothetical protein
MQNYNFIQKIFHDLVLGIKFINKSLYEIEKMIFLKNQDSKELNHIFISGLPRSGTTSILNFIYSFNQHASLTYQSMPFVLSPNISKVLNKKNIVKKERLHTDGISYDLESPEALDEIFFKNNNNFIHKELINYLNLILISQNKSKYLSKNNNNFKRIDLINLILPNSIFLIPIREPLQQAQSLLNQHLNFSRLQKSDDFIRRYMNYLGHNEFGLNHKPWNDPINYKDLNNINYWVEQWSLFYEHIFYQYHSYENCYFIIYEELQNSYYVEKLLNKINLINFKNSSLKFFKNSNKKIINSELNNNNYQKSLNIYEKFIKLQN